MTRNPREFIDLNGGYQSHREGVDKEAHDAWVETNTWGLSFDDFIRLSYFKGCLELGSDGYKKHLGWEGGSKAYDTVYMNEAGAVLTRQAVSYWIQDYYAFMRGFKKAKEKIGET